MDWIQNAISYYDKSDPGICPACGSRRVSVVVHRNGIRKSLTFTCEDCRSSDHFDGVTQTGEDNKAR